MKGLETDITRMRKDLRFKFGKNAAIIHGLSEITITHERVPVNKFYGQTLVTTRSPL